MKEKGTKPARNKYSATLRAGDRVTCKIAYTAKPGDLKPGTLFLLRPCYHGGLPFSWQCTRPDESDYVSARFPAGCEIAMSCTEEELRIELLNGTVPAGSQIEICLGDKSQGGDGLRIWPVVHDLEFDLVVEPKPDSPRQVRRISMRVVSGEAAKLLVRNPSILEPGGETEVLVRAVDRFGNTASGFKGKVRLFSDAVAVEPAEVGFSERDRGVKTVKCRLGSAEPNAVVRINARAERSKLTGTGNPAESLGAGEGYRIFWGDLHCHSNLGQALEDPEFLYDYARHAERLDFIAHTEHDAADPTGWVGNRWMQWRKDIADVEEYIAETWEARKELVKRYYEPNKFVTLLGYEWASNIYGHMNVYYMEEDGPIFYPADFWSEEETPAMLWEALGDREAMTIPHHTSNPVNWGSPQRWRVSGFDWNFHDPRYLCAVEIYSKWGNSEYLGCPRALRNQATEGCVQTALARGLKVGFVASSDTHASRPGSDLAGDLFVRQSGLTAVFAPSLTREAVYSAVKQRLCYATTGERIIMRFWVNGSFMGSDITVADGRSPKEMVLDVQGTTDLGRVEVVKNNDVIFRAVRPGLKCQEVVTDRTATGRTDFYYLRVIQVDGSMGWSSPVWVSRKGLLS